MENVKRQIVFIFLMLFTLPLFSQTVLDGVYIKEHVPTRKVIAYSHLREADVMWNKRIWRLLVVDEKINLPFKYPLHKDMKDRRNLIDVIHDAAMEGTLTIYKSGQNGGDDEFTFPMTTAEVTLVGAAKADTLDVQDPVTLEFTKKIIPHEFDRDKVYKYKIKEDWFFDKQRSVMDVRIIGIAPIRKKVSESGEEIGDEELYWIYFPEARKIFVNQEVFNKSNDAERRTFDDIFFKRMFSSYIFKESNVYNRRIQDYKLNPLDALLEAQRIKTDIVNYEHDLWEY